MRTAIAITAGRRFVVDLITRRSLWDGRVRTYVVAAGLAPFPLDDLADDVRLAASSPLDSGARCASTCVTSRTCSRARRTAVSREGA
jgi:hypothetical protein